MSSYMELEKDTRRRISTAIRYPIFVLVAIAIAIVILNIWVIPVFGDLFSKFGAELPLPTKILIGTSNFFVSYWPLFLLGTIGVVGGTRYYLATESSAAPVV